MISRIFTALDVDRVQWTALMKFAFQTANRTPRSVGGQYIREQGSELNKALIPFFLISLFYGISYSMLVLMLPSLNWSVFVIFSMVGISVGMTMLVEFGSLIAAPDDFAVLAYRPVSSRTYFAVKVSFTLTYVILTTLSLGLPGCVMMAFKTSQSFTSIQFRPEILGVSVIALLMLGMATAMGMILLYTIVLRFIRSTMLQSILSFLQITMSMAVFGSYMILPGIIGNGGAEASMDLPGWSILLPQTWFASIVFLADGQINTPTLFTAAAAMLLTVVVIPSAVRTISSSYSEHISRAYTESSTVRSVRSVRSERRSFGKWADDETRAMAVLIRGQFRSDTQFRMSILGMIPMMGFYLFMGLNEHDIQFDPFVGTLKDVMRSIFIYMPLLLFPMILVEGVSKSRSHQATWIFFSTPADTSQLILSMEKLLFRFYMIPYIILLAICFIFLISDHVHGFLHAVLLLVFSAVSLKILFIMYPRLPFNRPVQFAEKLSMVTVLTSAVPLILTGGLLALFPVIYSGPFSYTVSIAILIGWNVALKRLLKKRVCEYVKSIEYQW